MDISVILVNWNGKKYLEECFRSIKNNLLGVDHEIIVVDNGSSDGSQPFIALNYPDIQLISMEKNLGFAKANNIAIRKSKGKYIILVNTDVVVKEGCIKNLINYMESNSKVGMVGPKVISGRGDLQLSCMEYPTIWNMLCRALALDKIFEKSRAFGGYKMTYWKYDEIRQVDVINGVFWLIKREALDLVGTLDERFFMYGEDIDWSRRFNESGWKVVYYPYAEIIHYGGGSSENSPVRFYIEMNRANLQLSRKYENKLRQIIYLCIVGLHQIIRMVGYGTIFIFKIGDKDKYIFKIRRSSSCLKWLALEAINAKKSAN